MNTNQIGPIGTLAAILCAVALSACATSQQSVGTASPSASAQADCLDAAIVAAIDELDSGNLDTDPPIEEVADALEALPMEGAAAEARDRFVDALRQDPPDEEQIVMAAVGLHSQVALPEC